MRRGFEPFELVEEGRRTILRLHGTEEQRAKVDADGVHIIMDAIARGWDIDVLYADIDGNFDILAIVGRLEKDEDGRYVVAGNMRVASGNVSGEAFFWEASFNGEANFAGTRFNGKAFFSRATFNEVDFEGASFNGEASFAGTRFNGKAFFSRATFNEVNFEGASFNGEASFAAAQFNEAFFWEAHFNGEANFDEARFNEVFFVEASFNGEANFAGTRFNGKAFFSRATFNEVDFTVARFNETADFEGASFNGEVSFAAAHFNEAFFWEARFNEIVDFEGAHFGEIVDFRDAKMRWPASFYAVQFQENDVWAGLKNEILSPTVSRLTGGRIKLEEVTVTDCLGFNTVTIMDGSSNPRLKRYIDDEQWIDSWRNSGKLQRGLFYVWEVMCHCGRSIGLWAGWSAFFALLFAFIYWLFGCDSIAFDVGRLGGQQPNFLGYFYYSVVTFTTLGFGDIVPLTNWARLAVGAEVVCGYVMLGGLISIFANKLARRS